MKYSINGTGNIVAERDIYSLGGFIPKGTVGGKIASEAQLSQDGECWLEGGDISDRPDVRVKDNAYIGVWVAGSSPVHTDGITEFSGNVLIPGRIIVRNLVADTKNNFFAKDSFIGVSMDVLCGPAATTAFPFGQGDFRKEAEKGTLFASMGLEDVSACRSTSILRPGRNTYLYIPAGYRARVFWAYYNTSNQLAYSGESMAIAPGLTKLDHPVYKLAMVVVVKGDGTAMTPTDLLATGAKILGHVSGSVTIDIRPESASGSYVMNNSSFIMNTDNFGLVTSQLRYLAGSMYDTNMYTPGGSTDYKIYGTFHKVQRLEYTKSLGDAHRTNVNRDRYISAYDCPLLRVDSRTYDASLASKGNLTLRRCIVPKAEFQDDVINGNTYEDIDFSFANEDLGYTMTGYARFISSHKQGIYRVKTGTDITQGLVSHKGNLEASTRLYTNLYSIPLDGSIIEQGSYTASVGQFYEEGKSGSISTRIRTGKPVSTFGLVLPTMPSGYVLAAAHYLDEGLKFAYNVPSPSSINTDYPYVVFVITKADPSEPALISEFTTLNMTLRIEDRTKAPEITGSAYVGAGCTVRGDIKLIGDPYVNRLLDVNLWEWGGIAEGLLINGWTTAKIISGGRTDVYRRRFKELIPVEPGAKITCNSGYWVRCYFFDYEGNYISTPGWGQIANTAPANAAFAGVILKKSATYTDDLYIEDSDILLANVKYVRAFKKRRYITNELDRTSPEDVFLTEDLWRVAAFSTAPSSVGKLYEDLISTSDKWCILKRLFNMGSSRGIQLGNSDTYKASYSSWDASTKLLGSGITDRVALTGLEIGKKDDSIVTLEDVPAARLVLEFVPQPRIIVPYGSSALFISGPKIRMYDNAVLSRNLNQEGEIVLQGDAVMGYDFNSGECLCSNGHSDAIIKLP